MIQILCLSLFVLLGTWHASQAQSVDVTGLVSVPFVWEAPAKGEVLGYKLHVGNAPGAYQMTHDVGLTLAHTLANLTPGQVYYVAATAYGADRKEGPFSNEVVFTAEDKTVVLMGAPQGLQIPTDAGAPVRTMKAPKAQRKP